MRINWYLSLQDLFFFSGKIKKTLRRVYFQKKIRFQLFNSFLYEAGTPEIMPLVAGRLARGHRHSVEGFYVRCFQNF